MNVGKKERSTRKEEGEKAKRKSSESNTFSDKKLVGIFIHGDQKVVGSFQNMKAVKPMQGKGHKVFVYKT